MPDFLPRLDYNLPTIIFLVFCLAALLQLLHLSFIYARFAFHKEKKRDTPLAPVSVLIAARNESENLFRHLPFILEQNYPEFEVIVINHQSLDDSEYILDAYAHQYPHLRVIKVERSQHLKYGKKLPLTLGIKGAKYEHLVFTDADCKPNSNMWLQSMAGNFTAKHEIVLGYGPYKKRKGLLNRLIRFDTAWIAMSYFSMAKAGLPYMGIGRNLAYTRKVFNEVKGFKSHYSLASGDDDLFIQEAAKNRNYTINVAPESFCYSPGAKTWSQWMKQKSRHFTTTPKYKVFKKLMLGIYPLSLLILTISFVILLFDSGFLWISLAIYLLVLTIKWIILGRCFRKLQESKFVAWLPLLDLAYAILAPAIYYATDKTDTKKW
jgi:cellulose synthase/poly-beta-1,6-N-acetylglucosamine synthase-like glycosyltransferase